MPRIILVISALLLFGCVTTDHDKVSKELVTGNTSESGNVKEKDNADDKDKVVCNYERKTGSHFKTKVCKTLAQIKLEQEEAQRAHGRALSGPMSSTTE